jgi:predicted Zn finger-like uncharacterized protein
MSLATSCSHCGTIFRVVQDQLKASEGWVRCGHCQQVFNALEGLFDLERREPLAAPPSFAESSSSGEFAPFARTPSLSSDLPGPSAWTRSDTDPVSGGFRYGDSFPGGFQSPLARVIVPPTAPPPSASDTPAAAPSMALADQLALSRDPNDPAWAETKPALFSDLDSLRQRQIERQEAGQARLGEPPLPAIPAAQDPAESTLPTAPFAPDPGCDPVAAPEAADLAPHERPSSSATVEPPLENAISIGDDGGLFATGLVTRPGLRTWRQDQEEDNGTLEPDLADDLDTLHDDAGPHTTFEPTVWSVEWLPPAAPPAPHPADPAAAQEMELSLDLIHESTDRPFEEHRREPDFSSLDDITTSAAAEPTLDQVEIELELPALDPAQESTLVTGQVPVEAADEPGPIQDPLPDHEESSPLDQLLPLPAVQTLAAEPLTAPSAALAGDEAEEADPAIAATPSFVKAADRQARWSRPWMRVGLSTLALLGAAALVGQAAVQWRNQLAARAPWTRPWLVQACEAMGCKVEAPRRLDALVVDSTALMQPPGIDGYKLQIQLRNRAEHEVATPWIDLNLNDSNGGLIVRRALPPAAFQQPDVLAAQTDATWQIEFTVPGQKISGYTLSVFYP